MKHGTKVIFFDRLNPKCWDVGYFLFAANYEQDPLGHYYLTTKKEYLQTITDYDQMIKLIESETIKNSEVPGVLCDNITEYSDKIELLVNKTCNFYLKKKGIFDQLQLESLIERIFKYDISYKSLLVNYYLKYIIYKIRHYFNFYARPLLGILCFDIYYLFILNRELIQAKNDVTLIETKINNFEKGVKYYRPSSVDTIKNSYQSQLEEKKVKYNDSRNNLLKTSRNIATIIFAVITLFLTYLYYNNKVDDLTKQIQECQQREKNIQNQLYDQKIFKK